MSGASAWLDPTSATPEELANFEELKAWSLRWPHGAPDAERYIAPHPEAKGVLQLDGGLWTGLARVRDSDAIKASGDYEKDYHELLVALCEHDPRVRAGHASSIKIF